jgi:lipopolysaccharide export system ATP-binding protein
LILFLKQRGLGILITDHNVRETLQIVDRASIMFDGEVMFEGSPQEVLASAVVRERYLGKDYH